MAKNKVSRVLVVGDLHDNPKDNKRRFKWIAKCATAEKPDAVILLGDLSDFDSLCSHMPNHTHEGKTKLPFQKDLESLAKAFQLMDEHLELPKSCIKHITLGNHDNRIWLFENENPESYGSLSFPFIGMLESYGWSWTPYGKHFDFQGVQFTHRPLNGMGRPMGGKFAARAVAADTLLDTVFADTHKFNDFSLVKSGQDIENRRVRVVECGCAMEWGKIKKYARFSTTGWWWGVVMLTIINGRIEGVRSIPMFRLKQRYN